MATRVILVFGYQRLALLWPFRNMKEPKLFTSIWLRFQSVKTKTISVEVAPNSEICFNLM